MSDRLNAAIERILFINACEEEGDVPTPEMWRAGWEELEEAYDEYRIKPNGSVSAGGYMRQCKCGSFAINPGHHGRDNTDLDLCDVCYWRKRAEAKDDTVKRVLKK